MSSNPYVDALEAWTVAPVFSQPILPGWTIVNNFNSGSPRAESMVVSKFSYGRQLGQICDALAAIIDDLPPDTKKDAAVKKFLAMRDAIDVLKAVS